VVDRLDRGGHHAVVGGHHEHGHVGELRAAGAQGRKGRVTRGVEEDDRALGRGDLVGAHFLGNPAGLALGHARADDGVEEGGLAVVDVAHHGDDGRARHQLAHRGVERQGLGDDLVGVERDVLDGKPELAREQLVAVSESRVELMFFPVSPI
jgi:hypothetical protein